MHNAGQWCTMQGDGAQRSCVLSKCCTMWVPILRSLYACHTQACYSKLRHTWVWHVYDPLRVGGMRWECVLYRQYTHWDMFLLEVFYSAKLLVVYWERRVSSKPIRRLGLLLFSLNISLEWMWLWIIKSLKKLFRACRPNTCTNVAKVHKALLLVSSFWYSLKKVIELAKRFHFGSYRMAKWCKALDRFSLFNFRRFPNWQYTVEYFGILHPILWYHGNYWMQ